MSSARDDPSDGALRPRLRVMVTGRIAVVVACLGLTAAACASDKNGASNAATTTINPSAASYTTNYVTTTSTLVPGSTTSSFSGTANEGSTPVVLSVEDAHLVADCVQYIPIGAVLADKEASDLFAVIGMDLTKLNELCAGLLHNSLATLNSLSLKLTAYEIGQEKNNQPAESGNTTTSVSANDAG